jgi:hypothetical protein
VPCGSGAHVLRWEAGELRLPAHPDAEAELVLAALGGERAGCVQIAETWARHTDDLSVLAIGPRDPADKIAVGWELLQQPPGQQMPGQPASGQPAPGQQTVLGQAMAFPIASTPRAPRPAGLQPQFRQALRAEVEQARKRTAELLSLLALGTAFQLRLAGHVAAAHAARLAAANRPALSIAIEGRMAMVAEDWIGLDPDQVLATVHDGDGWGAVALTGKGADRRLRVALPAGWLASVWACGLGLVGRHLVVAVIEPGWPDARVLALRAPGAEPAPLEVHHTGLRWEA